MIFGRLIRDKAGVTSIEYGLLTSLIGLGLITGAESVGSSLYASLTDVETALLHGSSGSGVDGGGSESGGGDAGSGSSDSGSGGSSGSSGSDPGPGGGTSGGGDAGSASSDNSDPGQGSKSNKDEKQGGKDGVTGKDKKGK